MKKVQDNMGNYEHYKMYKSGKNWVYSAITVGMIATGVSFITTNVHADTIKDNIQQSEQISSSKQTGQQSTVSLQTKDNASSKENNLASSTNQSINASNKEVTTASKATNETASELGNRSNIKNNSVNAQKDSANTTNISNNNKAGRITSSLKNEANLKSDSLNGERNSTSKQDTPNNNVTAKVSSFGIDQTKQRNNALVASKKITNDKQNMLSNSNSGATAKVAINNNDSKKLTNNIKNRSDVPARYLANAKVKGPFTAGVNQIIPFEAFGGDGMLTRLLLNGSEKAAWSDNGAGKNAAISPITGLKAGEYFYEVDLGGNAKGKEGQALLDQLRSNGTKTYDATVKIYGVGADGKADTTKVVATKTGLKLSVAGLTSNVKNTTKVPAQYLANAKAKGPFTAGVNQVIPFEAFGGDGMLTRLLLNGSEKAAWSDNGTGKNAAILPNTGLKAGEYFYEVDLGGNAKGKEGQALLDQLRSNGTKTYDATVKIYEVGADGKADTTKVVATKKGLRITINVGKNNITTSESKNNITDVQKFTSKNNKEKQSNKNSTISGMKETQSGKTNNSLMTTNTNVKKTDNRRMPDQNNSHILNREVSKNHSDKMDIQKESMLPQTGEKSNSILNIIGIALLGLVALVGSVFKLGKKKSD
ncbi:LPXTG cell wall anchor domain-containing protein [Pediococcus pentosaceus]|uniref:LPXTG cell wall anchor domain-containing protein n=1 Tax=Pediococcus pentosaceus TaxID=1255 RepID=A0ABQ6XIE2_PEDPE|nr:fibronectin-binding SSURE repeat-containing protein [Pediococcus pentosaceus]KAF0413873.1 LPXTG cell wall anchor domain-containing protein [Pediococcus pentosaceus]KAF0501144.1 LPXTG cell wall anchor domain-containing protein [Pediococcus pentosaceus]